MNFLAFLTLVSAVSSVCLAGRTQSRDSSNKEDCYAQEKIYDRATNKCYKLLTKGPCPKGSWFVLEKPEGRLNENQLRIAGKCVREKCGDGEFYWGETNSCVNAKDKAKICRNPRTEELRYDVFGDGECSCTAEPPRARLHNNKNNSCFELYTKGPCRAGEVLGFLNSVTDEPTCIPDLCYYESLHRKRIRTLAPEAVLAPWKNTCHELGTQGPCREGHTFKVHPKGKRPACVAVYAAIFTANSDYCIRDINNVCQRKVTKKASANKYLKELTDVLQRARNKQSS